MDRDQYLILNTGNFVNYGSMLAQIEAQYVVAGLNMSGVNMIGIGAWDLKWGVDKIEKLAPKSVADFVCANVDGFLPYLRFERGGLKILVTVVVDPELLKIYGINGVKAKDPGQAIKDIEKNISHDFFIVVTHARGERNQEMLAGCSGIDLIIDGEKPRTVAENETLLGVPVVRNNLGGKYVGYVDIYSSGQKKLKVGFPTLIRVPSKTVAEDPQVAELVKRYEEERRIAIVKEQKKREQLALAKQKSALTSRTAGNLYLGSSWCGSCHGVIEKKWRKSRHAGAISSLTAKGRDNDPACISCHVTGLHDPHAVGGFVSMEKNPNMSGVQCEACHGPGGRHAPVPDQVKMRSVNEVTCRACHNHDTDPTFDFENDIKIIDHGKMPPINK